MLAFGCHVIAVGGTMLCCTGATEGMSDLDLVLDLKCGIQKRNETRSTIESHYMILESRSKVLARDNTE